MSMGVDLENLGPRDKRKGFLADIERNHGNLSVRHQSTEKLTERVEVNEMALQSLSRQVSGRVRIEFQIEEGNRNVEMAFLTKAFAIFVAFQVQLYFHEQVLLHSSRFHKDDEWDEVCVRTIWFAMVVVLMPLGLYKTRKQVAQGIRKRPFTENARVLAKYAVPMLFVWAFKDVVAAFIKTIKKPYSCQVLKTFDAWEGTGVTEATCQESSVGSVFEYMGYLTIAALCAAVLHFSVLKISQQCRNFEQETKGAKIYLNHLANTAPFALGVGYGWNHILQAFVEDLILEKLFAALDSTEPSRHLLAYSVLSVVKAAAVSWIALMMTFSSEDDEARKEAAGIAHSLKTPRTSWECAFFRASAKSYFHCSMGMERSSGGNLVSDRF